jgi:hypothetical protein
VVSFSLQIHYLYIAFSSREASQLELNKNHSDIHLLNLPNKILLIILKKLNNVDVLYSLLNVHNEQLNFIAQEKIFSDTLDFAFIDNICSIDRFHSGILPRIHHNVKFFLLISVSMERILLVAKYSNIIRLKICNFKQEISWKHFTRNMVTLVVHCDVE